MEKNNVQANTIITHPETAWWKKKFQKIAEQLVSGSTLHPVFIMSFNKTWLTEKF